MRWSPHVLMNPFVLECWLSARDDLLKWEKMMFFGVCFEFGFCDGLGGGERLSAYRGEFLVPLVFLPREL